MTTRIYVACLASYNNGILHGAWVDADQGVDLINEDIQAMLKASPVPGAEEYAIHDYEGFEGIKISEYENLDSVSEMAEAITEHGSLYGALRGYGFSHDEAISKLEDDYQGTYASLEDWAENFLEDTGAFSGAPEMLQTYFDFERYARDARLGGDILEFDTPDGVAVFWNH